MSTLKEVYNASSNLELWYKLNNGDELTLADIPNILPLRWNYFKDNWEFIRSDVEQRAELYNEPDFLLDQIKSFTQFIEYQRNLPTRINAFNDVSVLNRFHAIFENIFINSINLTNQEQDIVNDLTRKVSAYSKNDFLNIRNIFREYRDRYTDSINLTDETYNSTYNRSAIAGQVTATIADLTYIQQIQNGIKSVDFILANYFANDAVLDHFALARQNVNNPDIDIGQYLSGTLVKMEYGEDLQALANRYLGDPLKWVDIAIANGLKPPYIDEVGERLPLIANGNGNQINLSAVDLNGRQNIDKLYINQIVILKSNTQVAPDQRKIINIRQVPVSLEIIIELDGASDLDKYKIGEGAFIRIFKPNTVNSSLYVLIPSSKPLENARREDIPWFLEGASEDEKQAKIDIAVNDDGDIIFSPNGDLKLSYGIDNAIQALKFKIMTELGSLRFHPEYGIVNLLGSKNTSFSQLQTTLSNSIVSQIESDSRFERVESLSVDLNSASMSKTALVNLVVRLAGGGNKTIPISFAVNI
jgi:hypothetical protein